MYPNFNSIETDKISHQIDAILQQNINRIDELVAQDSFSWSNLMQPLEDIDDRLHQFWSPISHLNSVMNSDKLRNVYNECLPKLSEYSTAVCHNQKLYKAIQSIADGQEYHNLDFAQKKVVDNHIRDFKLSGVALDPQKKQRFAELSKKLALLSAEFEQNLLDATQAWHKHITDKNQLAGLPDSAIAAAKDAAEQKKMDGWIFTLEIPSYLAVMNNADSASLRQEMYYAYTTRASDQGPCAGQFDNSAIMSDIVACRLQLAQLLDFEHPAALSLATKMVNNADDVLNFLQQLADASTDKAKNEYQQLAEFAKEEYSIAPIQAHDIAYLSEQLRKKRYDISQETLRPYFAEPNVLKGLFNIVKKLFSVSIKLVSNIDVWHPDVQCYALFDSNNNLISHVYLDLYARENKRGGAWMDDFCGRRRLHNGELQLPIAFITCNFSAPIDDQPALFKHDEVITLFHEFGHALQHMLTTIEYADVSGINGVPWDAVEIASQFLENWAWQRESLQLFAHHYQTNEILPDDLFDKMHAAKNFQSAMAMVRQLEFALFDFKLHLATTPLQVSQIQETLNQVREKVSAIPTPEFNRFQHGFSHIFAGGYAAGYYSYKWAEVMAADAFSLFLEQGIFDKATSARFLETFLQCGGAIEPSVLFEKFRGRAPKMQPLLIQTGIQSA